MPHIAFFYTEFLLQLFQSGFLDEPPGGHCDVCLGGEPSDHDHCRRGWTEFHGPRPLPPGTGDEQQSLVLLPRRRGKPRVREYSLLLIWTRAVTNMHVLDIPPAVINLDRGFPYFPSRLLIGPCFSKSVHHGFIFSYIRTVFFHNFPWWFV